MFVQVLDTYFPKADISTNENKINAWYVALCDIDYNLAQAALIKYALTNKWQPTVADIRESALSLIDTSLDWSESWKIAIKLVKKYGSDKALKAKAEMDELTRETVERIGYIELCQTQSIEIVRGQYRQVYEQVKEKHRMNKLLPVNLTETIKKIQENGMMLLIDENEKGE